MINQIYKDRSGHKKARPVKTRKAYLALRNAPENAKNFYDARGGDVAAKAAQVQFNYNDLLPNGVLKGCRHPSSTFAHDIDCGDAQEQTRIKELLLAKKEEIGLLELSGSARYGLHAVCRRKPGTTIREGQYAVSMITQTEYDTNARGLARVMYTGPATADNLFYLDDAIFEEPLSVEQSAEEYKRLKERERSGREEIPGDRGDRLRDRGDRLRDRGDWGFDIQGAALRGDHLGVVETERGRTAGGRAECEVVPVGSEPESHLRQQQGTALEGDAPLWPRRPGGAEHCGVGL